LFQIVYLGADPGPKFTDDLRTILSKNQWPWTA